MHNLRRGRTNHTKRLIVAAALAASALVPATQSMAIPPSTAGGPLGWGAACMVVGNPAIPATCRFTANNAVGYAGGAGPGGTVTLSHKETRAVCDQSVVPAVIKHVTTTVVDDSAGAAPDYLGSQGGLINGVVYTLTVTGSGGFAIAGGQSTPAAAPPAEPADTARDLTGGKKVGDLC